jgi:hypothetical protein
LIGSNDDESTWKLELRMPSKTLGCGYMLNVHTSVACPVCKNDRG